jgi:hypothetical protein
MILIYELRTTPEERKSLINEIDTILEDIKKDQEGYVRELKLKTEPLKEQEEDVNEHLEEQDDVSKPLKEAEKEPLKEAEKDPLKELLTNKSFEAFEKEIFEEFKPSFYKEPLKEDKIEQEDIHEIEQEDLREMSPELENPKEEYVEFFHHLQEEPKNDTPVDREAAIEGSLESKERHQIL